MITKGSKIHIVYTNGKSADAIFNRWHYDILLILNPNNLEEAIPLSWLQRIQEVA